MHSIKSICSLKKNPVRLTSTCLSTSLRGSVADSISSVWKAPLTGRGLVLMNWRRREFCWRKSSAWEDNTRGKRNHRRSPEQLWQPNGDNTDLYHCNLDKTKWIWGIFHWSVVINVSDYVFISAIWTQLFEAAIMLHTFWCPAMTLPSGNR